jgi:hypothetical protein
MILVEYNVINLKQNLVKATQFLAMLNVKQRYSHLKRQMEDTYSEIHSASIERHHPLYLDQDELDIKHVESPLLLLFSVILFPQNTVVITIVTLGNKIKTKQGHSAIISSQ